MPPLSHLTSCTPTKSNLYLANSLPLAVSEPALYRLLTFHVLKKSPFPCCLILPLETPPPGDPSGGVVYLRIVLSPEEAFRLVFFFTGRHCYINIERASGQVYAPAYFHLEQFCLVPNEKQ